MIGSFLLWGRELVPQFFKEIFKRPDEAHKLAYLIAAVRDPVKLLRNSVHDDPEKLVSLYGHTPSAACIPIP